MNKRGKWAIILGIILLVILILLIFFYYALYSPRNEIKYSAQGSNSSGGGLVNPVIGISNEQAVSEFNESFVYYLLYSIKAYNLHNPPLSSSKPIIQIYVSNDPYYAIIDKGAINVNKGTSDKKDIIIRTTKEEAVKMLQSKEYVATSFESGTSSIELVESKSLLFGKGYLNLYTQLTGKSVTGNVINIYTK
jgi:hypothetical protein